MSTVFVTEAPAFHSHLDIFLLPSSSKIEVNLGLLSICVHATEHDGILIAYYIIGTQVGKHLGSICICYFLHCVPEYVRTVRACVLLQTGHHIFLIDL